MERKDLLDLKSLMKVLGNSPALMAFALVLSVNCLLSVFSPFNGVDPHKLPWPKSWSWWSTQNFLREDPPPNVILLGSSLMMNPIWQNEANFLQKSVDIVKDRRVRYLEDGLKSILPDEKNVKCFNLALPGAMISDDYMVVRSLLAGPRRPRLLIMGLSPRDFTDNGFYCAASSDHYQYLSRLTDSRDLVELAMPQLWQRWRYYVNSVFYLTGKRSDLQVCGSEKAREIMQPYLASSVMARSRLTRDDTVAGNAIYKTEIQSGVYLAHPNVPDYYNEIPAAMMQRYAGANAERQENQRQWFEKLLHLCKDEGIQPFIVIMPQTPMAISFFPPGVYDQTRQMIAETASRYNFPCIDLPFESQFNANDFTDMCHMDGSGGKKVLDAVLLKIGKDSRLADALQGRGTSLARTGGGSM